MKYLAIDIGGTNLKYGYVSQDGRLLQHWTIPVPTNYNDLLQKITAIYLSSENILGVGISSPGIYDMKSNRITGSSALKYLIGRPLKADISLALNTTVAIENDGNCALLGEYWQGNCQYSRSSAIYVIGSAVGGSIQISGEILRGANNNAGELGYSLVDNLPTTDKYSSLGGKIGFNALLKKINQQGYKFENGKDLFLKSQTDRKLEKLIIDELKYLASALITLQYVIDPEVILIGGGVSQNTYFMSLVGKALKIVQSKRPNYKVLPVVLPAKYGNDANLLGAIFNLIS
ncbi:ROK family protein [Enterococcus faecium]|uniref:ROK family protein n=1 Tax=Enterococcus faecium TaxID=1352 RepID=UPI00155F62FF|nr:ROK family protein [Enterococcus faecium]EGP5688672.1 ROK family protein [Enterococcus faecium]EME8087085.1 ROK family protein [Enterococcus faecium]EME8198842.1 ROK family protein [Enterococcus faecium]NRE54715.1 ROK family protein [Enterococcus faecium]